MKSIPCSVLAFLFFAVPASAVADPMLSAGRTADPPAKVLSEIRAAERRKIPLEVYLKASSKYEAGDPVEITVIVTNLFPTPLLMNSRMLVNHIRLQGEISFRITDEKGKVVDIRSLVTPLAVREDDFVILGKGESMQRTVDLADIFGLSRKGDYTVYASYHNEVDFIASGQRAWKGRVWSDPVQLQLH